MSGGKTIIQGLREALGIEDQNENWNEAFMNIHSAQEDEHVKQLKEKMDTLKCKRPFDSSKTTSENK